MNKIQLRFILSCFTVFCLAWGLAPLALAQNSITINNSVSHSVWGNGVDNEGTPPIGPDDPQDPNNNEVIINADVNGSVFGAFDSANGGPASENTVTVNSGNTVTGDAVGGYASNASAAATASQNAVAISGTVGGAVIGGQAQAHVANPSVTATANDNSVTINNGTAGGGNWIRGGWASSTDGPAEATGNSVTIDNSTVNGDIYGGYATSTNGYVTATGNSVTISGGTVTGNVFGGQVITSSGSASATHNIVTISGSPTFDGSNPTLAGGDIDGSGDAFTGNTLNLHSPITVFEVQNFQNLNFYLPTTLAAGEAMLTVTGTARLTENLGGAGKSSTVNVGIDGGSSPLAVNDQVVLIDASSATGDKLVTNSGLNTTANGQGMQGVSLKYEFDIEASDEKLTAIVAKIGGNEQTKALSEGFLAGSILVNQGADLIAGPGMTQAAAAAAETGPGAFGAIAGGRSRYDTGSHVDMSSVALLTGLAWGLDATPGHLTLGAFFEYGNGNYDTYNSFPTAASVRGDGDADRFGGGVLGRLDFAEAGPGHAYVEASGRLGRVDNDYHSADLRDFLGRQTSFDSSSAYYGLHLGAGYLWDISEATALDLYAQYFWSGVEGDSLTLSTGDPVQFEDTESQRLRLGGRFSFNQLAAINPYVGLAWEHEFDGEVRGTASGYSIDPPSLRGDTGLGEIGVTLKPSPERPLSFDLGLTGYAGRRQGAMGTFTMKLEF